MDDVIIVGGSFAGLSAALQLGRARRRVTVLDTGLPRNRYAAHAHGLLGHDGKPPTQILAEGRAQLGRYPSVRLLDVAATALAGTRDAFTVTTAAGENLAARRLILSYGITDVFPDIEGFAQCWGRSVLHCPYCHGFEVADGRLGLLYSSPLSLHAMALLHDWSARLTLFTNGQDLPEAEHAKLARRGVAIVTGRVAGIDHRDGHLSSIRIEQGDPVPLDALFAHPRQRLAADLHGALGLDLTEGPLGELIAVGDDFQTSLPGVYAAGDLAHPMQSAHLALSRGSMAGVHCHQSLIV
ncbi:NAD(P)/FAD-dependent oxidoreductase [uncultured Devosia sp.]|uniref:NAD(P)/FAD-dependent oxidoreductase n=1 Tax=uncultured Devosia sp. TaxID=211434 RepID=UPI0035C96449